MRKLEPLDQFAALVAAFSSMLLASILGLSNYVGPPVVAKAFGVPVHPWMPYAIRYGFLVSVIVALGFIIWVFPFFGRILLKIIRTILRIGLWMGGFGKESSGVWKFKYTRIHFVTMFVLMGYVWHATDHTVWMASIICTFILVFFAFVYQSTTTGMSYNTRVDPANIPVIIDQTGRSRKLLFTVEPALLPWVCFTDWVTIFAPLAPFVAFGPLIYASASLWLLVVNPSVPLTDLTGRSILKWWPYWVALVPDLVLIVHWYFARGRRYGLTGNIRDKTLTASRPKPGFWAYVTGQPMVTDISAQQIAETKMVPIKMPLPRFKWSHWWWPFETVDVLWSWNPGFQFSLINDDVFTALVGYTYENVDLLREWVKNLNQR